MSARSARSRKSGSGAGGSRPNSSRQKSRPSDGNESEVKSIEIGTELIIDSFFVEIKLFNLHIILFLLTNRVVTHHLIFKQQSLICLCLLSCCFIWKPICIP